MKKKLIALTLAMTALTMAAGAEDYTLRAGDQLNIIVTQDTDISSSTQSATQSPYLVRPDGKVSFPLVGEIDAKGMTVAEFTATLENGLSRYYVDPDVAVNIVKLGTVRVFVFGEVKKPGAYELTKGHSVIDAIGAAEGFTWDTAKKKNFPHPSRQYGQSHPHQSQSPLEDRQHERKLRAERRGHPLPHQEQPHQLLQRHRSAHQCRLLRIRD